jgi:NAD-dependent SIR2 family protein deacetylase
MSHPSDMPNSPSDRHHLLRREIDLTSALKRAADAVRDAEAIVIGAGAGMGVDSGLPDFRGNEGFWKAYPPYAKLGIDFASMASPEHFRSDPDFAWGFYGHRLMLYRGTRPHEGFNLLGKWAGRMEHGAFVYTSNVDGHFQKAGFPPDRVVEVHGAIGMLQCLIDCGAGLFPSEPYTVEIDESTMRATRPLPGCPVCGGLARPNILMFGDRWWDSSESDAQAARFRKWLKEIKGKRVVVVECGAGMAIPTVRGGCQEVARRFGGTLIRINPREPEVPTGHVSLPLPALEALRQIDALIARL